MPFASHAFLFTFSNRADSDSIFFVTKIMFFHLAFSVFLQPILHLNGLVDLNFKKALTA